MESTRVERAPVDVDTQAWAALSGGSPWPLGSVDVRPTRPLPHDGSPARSDARVPARILIVAEPSELDQGVLQRLRGDGHRLLVAASGEQALAIPDLSEFDLVLLDARLPGISGFDTCRELRAGSDTPIIFLTSAASLPERLLGFDVGADDYTVTPADFSELDRRMRAVLYRARGASRDGQELRGPSGVHMRPRAHEVFVGDEPIQLTPEEYALLQVLLRRHGDVLSSDEISRAIWGYETLGSRNFVEAHISRLRRKLSDAGADNIVETVRGIGYAIRER